MTQGLKTRRGLNILCAGAVALFLAGGAHAQSPAAVPTAGKAASSAVTPPAATAASPPAAAAPIVSSEFVIGAEDVLSIVFWREKDLSGDVVVRPDGRISLPLLNEVQASGLTPNQLRQKLGELADEYLEDSTVTVMVKQINSRRVFITGNVAKPGSYSLTSPTTVLQLISLAGGLNDFADSKNIVVARTENGQQQGFRFNYKDVSHRRNMRQNIELKPGDTVIVP